VEIERAMTRHELQHVIEKPYAGPDVVPSAAVEADAELDARFRGPAID
jgi:hypothetical protein